MGFARFTNPRITTKEVRDKWRTFRKQGPAALQAVDKVHPVELVEHRARFINLQRWYDTGTTLHRLHPASAVGGATDLGSLTMTPRDTWDLWEALRDVCSPETVAGVDPDDCLGGARITLDKSREYEEKLKALISTLPDTDLKRVLLRFQLKKPPHQGIDGWRVASFMRRKHFFPALFFQLDTCRCTDLFVELIETMESAERTTHPEYYSGLVAKRAKWEDAIQRYETLKARHSRMTSSAADRVNTDDIRELEELADPGPPIDDTAPHQDFILVSPVQTITREAFEDMVKRITKVDGLEPTHPYIRGLRRGVGLYVNDPHLQEYPRIIQGLAQHGQLAVVFSDASLAYGVNMPFRTTAFLGDDALLTPLMAAQMSGRAGRRGLDQEGNIVFLGMPMDRIRDLMLGTIANVCGRETRYPAVALQRALQVHHQTVFHDPRDFIRYYPVIMTPRRLEAIATVPLGADVSLPDPYTVYSWNVLESQGIVTPAHTLAVRPELAALVWELRADDPTLGPALINAIPSLLLAFGKQVAARLQENERAKMEKLEGELVAALLPIVHEHDPIVAQILVQRCSRSTFPGMTTHRWDDLKRRIYRFGSIIRLAHNCLGAAPDVYGPLVTLLRKTFRRVQWTMRDTFSSMASVS
jgi:ATP-dependent RNA helicase DDX60